jgi:hypothetical protein
VVQREQIVKKKTLNKARMKSLSASKHRDKGRPTLTINEDNARMKRKKREVNVSLQLRWPLVPRTRFPDGSKPRIHLVIEAAVSIRPSRDRHCVDSRSMRRGDAEKRRRRRRRKKHIQNQGSFCFPMTISQFALALPSHQTFPSVFGFPHSQSQRFRVWWAFMKPRCPYALVSLASSLWRTRAMLISSRVVMLRVIRRKCARNRPPVNNVNRAESARRATYLSQTMR